MVNKLLGKQTFILDAINHDLIHSPIIWIDYLLHCLLYFLIYI